MEPLMKDHHKHQNTQTVRKKAFPVGQYKRTDSFNQGMSIPLWSWHPNWKFCQQKEEEGWFGGTPVGLLVGVPQWKLRGSTRVGWDSSMCSRFPTLICILSYTPVQPYPPLQQLHSDFRGFNNGVWHIMKFTIAGSNTYMGLWTQTFCISPNFQARANETSMMTMSVASDQGQEELW